MKRLILAAALLALPLAACGPIAPPASPGDNAPAPAGPIAAVVAKLAELEGAYADVKRLVALFLPFASAERVAQVEAIEDRIDRAFATARRASTLAEQMAALTRAERAIAELAH